MNAALITGCNRGIGLGIAKKLSNAGFYVIGLNRSAMREKLSNYTELKCDVSDKKQIKKAFDSAIKKFGQINIVIHNAAIRKFNTVRELSEKDWETSVKTNLDSVFYLTKYSTPYLEKSKGYLIIVGSHSEKYTFGTGSAYCSTKAALRAFAECYLEEVRHDGIKVTYLSIGAVKNRHHGYEESWKLLPEDVGLQIMQILEMNPRALSSYIDLRPSQPLTKEKEGIEKLQYL